MEVNLPLDNYEPKKAKLQNNSTSSQGSSHFNQQLNQAKQSKPETEPNSQEGKALPKERQESSAQVKPESKPKSSDDTEHEVAAQGYPVEETQQDNTPESIDIAWIPVQHKAVVTETEDTDTKINGVPLEQTEGEFITKGESVTVKTKQGVDHHQNLSARLTNIPASSEGLSQAAKQDIKQLNLQTTQNVNTAGQEEQMIASDDVVIDEMLYSKPSLTTKPQEAIPVLTPEQSKSIIGITKSDTSSASVDLTQLKMSMVKTDNLTNIDLLSQADPKSLDGNTQLNAYAQSAQWAGGPQPKHTSNLVEVDNVRLDTLKLDTMELSSKELGDAFTQKIEMLARSNAQNAKITLDPPELGYLEVRISHGVDKVNVAFTASTQAGKDIIENNLDRLREMFVDNGLGAGELDVFMSNHEEHAHHAQWGGAGSGQDQKPNDELDMPTDPAPLARQLDNSLDMFI